MPHVLEDATSICYTITIPVLLVQFAHAHAVPDMLPISTGDEHNYDMSEMSADTAISS